MSKHLVIGVRPYDFVQQDTNERLQGVKVFYLDNHAEDDSSAKGYFPLNITLVGEHADKFKEVPGVYDLAFKYSPDKYGKPVIKLHDAKFVQAVKLPTVN